MLGQILLSDQRRVRADMRGDRRSVELYERPRLSKSKGCTESLSCSCDGCREMMITPTTHGGKPCTISKCCEGHWIGERKWHWL